MDNRDQTARTVAKAATTTVAALALLRFEPLTAVGIAMAGAAWTIVSAMRERGDLLLDWLGLGSGDAG